MKKKIIPSMNALIIVLINGVYSETFSSQSHSEKDDVAILPKEIIISSFAKAMDENSEIFSNHFLKYTDISTDAFAAMNTAFTSDGVFIFVPDNTIVKSPIYIINIISSKEILLIQPHFLFVIGKNSEIKIIDSINTLNSNSKTVCNSVAEISVGENAKVQFYKLQNNCEKVHLISSVNVHQQKKSHFNTITITLNGDWIRNNLNIVTDDNCESHLNGLFITHGAQHVDNHTLVDHRKPNCQSNQLYKGILGEQSTGVFNGKIFVSRDAQKTNAYQSNKNILLSDDATIYTKPQLEIYADDVKCSHGSTTGQINEDALFYLRSRGLNEDSAKNLLLFAFVDDVIEKIQIEPLKNHVKELVTKKLKKNK
ncbi:MAG: Fe-S cluster assembly protein SufD [Bacteroidota bacterium]